MYEESLAQYSVYELSTIKQANGLPILRMDLKF